MRSDRYEIEEEQENQEKTKKDFGKYKKIAIIIFLIFLAIFCYARFIEPSFIVIKEYINSDKVAV